MSPPVEAHELASAAIVTGEVIEVLPAFGVAHARLSDSRLLGLTRQTPGLDFSSLKVGQSVRLWVEPSYLRVAKVELIS